MLGWREIDFALISEASKIHPDFSKMEQLIDAGADVNAVRGDYENALSVIIGGFERCDCVETSSEKDSLPEVIEFFIKHGFDPERQIGKEWRKGMVGATCLVNLPLARCHATMIPAMKLLLDAGCRAINVNNPKYYGRFRHYNWNVWGSIGEGERLCGGNDGCLENLLVYGVLWQMLTAREYCGRYSYCGIDCWTAAYGGVLKRVFVMEPQTGALKDSMLKYKGCLWTNLFLEFDKGWLWSNGGWLVFYKDLKVLTATGDYNEEKFLDLTEEASSVVGSTLVDVEFSEKMRTDKLGRIRMISYNFNNGLHFTTRTINGMIVVSKPGE